MSEVSCKCGVVKIVEGKESVMNDVSIRQKCAVCGDYIVIHIAQITLTIKRFDKGHKSYNGK